VDIGGVIIERMDDDEDTSFFGDHYLDTPAVRGAFEALAAINGAGPFRRSVWLVSKCGPAVEARTREWLAAADFRRRTGIERDHLCFTRTRQEKAVIARQLGLTHFVDDRRDVLGHLVPAVPHRFLFNPEPAGHVSGSDGPDQMIFKDWPSLANALLAATDGRSSYDGGEFTEE